MSTIRQYAPQRRLNSYPAVFSSKLNLWSTCYLSHLHRFINDVPMDRLTVSGRVLIKPLRHDSESRYKLGFVSHTYKENKSKRLAPNTSFAGMICQRVDASTISAFL